MAVVVEVGEGLRDDADHLQDQVVCVATAECDAEAVVRAGSKLGYQTKSAQFLLWFQKI